MADPLSIAASVAGLASFSLQVSSSIAKYLDAIECRKSELESARNNLNALNQVLNIIKTHANHPLLQTQETCPSALHPTLQLCTAELQVLEALLAKLSDEGGGEAGVVGIAKKARQKIAYAFDREKLTQMGAKLGHSVQTLHLVLQVLHINLSTQALAAQKSIMATYMLSTNVEERLKCIVKTVERIEQKQLCPHDSQVTYDAVARNFISTHDYQVSGPQLLGRLVSKPAELGEMCNSYDQCVLAEQIDTIADPAQGLNHAQESETWSPGVTEYSGSDLPTCNCQPRRTLQRKRFFWSSLEIFQDTRTDTYHAPSCPLSRFTNRVDQTWGMRHVTVSKLLGYAVQLSFCLAFGSGGFSMGPTINFQAVVDGSLSPAFQVATMFNNLASHAVRASSSGILNHHDIDQFKTLFRIAMLKIETSYHQRTASPNDVNMDNETILYPILRGIDNLKRADKGLQQKGIELLQGLMRYRIPVDHHDNLGMSALRQVIGARHGLELEPAKLLFDGMTEIPLLMTSPRTSVYFARQILELCSTINDQRYLSLISEAIDSGYLSTEIMRNDSARIQQIVNSFPDTLQERNLFGHSPLHLSADKPHILRSLLLSVDQKTLDHTDTSGYTAIEHAMLSSKSICKSRSPSEILCRRCGCFKSTVMLLRADCAITSQSKDLSVLLRKGSLRCKKEFIKGLKNRRDRLLALAKEKLPKAKLSSLALVEGCVLDSQAPLVYRALLENGVKIPAPLLLSTNGDLKPLQGRWGSVYTMVSALEDAKLFFNMGFRDIDTLDWRGLPPMATFFGYPAIPYAVWLINRGADLFRRLQPIHVPSYRRFTTSAHYVFQHLGMQFDNIRNYGDSVHSLHREVFPAYITDDCSCYCSDQGCTPFLIMLKAITHTAVNALDHPLFSASPFSIYIGLYYKHMQPRQYMDAVRYLTFFYLEIQHTCQHGIIYRWERGPGRAALSVDDIDHIHAAQHQIYQLLESLIRRFGAEIMEILTRAGSDPTEIIRFWKETWVNQMWEEMEKLNGNDVPDDEKLAAEELGVVWDANDSEIGHGYTNELIFGDAGFFEDYFERLDKIGNPQNGL